MAAILDLIQLSSKSLWQLSKLLKVFLSHSKSQEYFQTGFKNWILSYKSSFRYSFYERVNPRWRLQAGLIEHFSFPSAWYQTTSPRPTWKAASKEHGDSKPGPQSSLHRSLPIMTDWKRKNNSLLHLGILSYGLKYDRPEIWSTG